MPKLYHSLDSSKMVKKVTDLLVKSILYEDYAFIIVEVTIKKTAWTATDWLSLQGMTIINKKYLCLGLNSCPFYYYLSLLAIQGGELIMIS